MTRNKVHALLTAAALALCALLAGTFPSQARAQAPSPAPRTAKVIKRHFAVVHMFPQSLQVSNINNPREILTFDYSPDLRDKMQNILNAGGYQYGDRVTVWYHDHTDVALKVKGKPSKFTVTAKTTK